MLKRLLLLCVSYVWLTGCATAPALQHDHAVTLQALKRPAVDKPTVAPYQLSDANTPGIEEAFKRYLRTGKAPNIKTDGFEVFAYNAGTQPIIKTTPLEETVISLEPGERFTNISSGDPSRWSYAVAVSGLGAQRQQHILVKPSVADSSTNMVITTDRRLYTLRLLSVATGEPARTVRFWYPMDKMATVAPLREARVKPEEEDAAVRVTDDTASGFHFNYTVSRPWFAPKPAWTPVRVFDDGIHTMIQFPPSLAHQDMPAFFVLEDNHRLALANYRSKPPYFIVDTLFKRAVLVLGVGRQQSKITITRT